MAQAETNADREKLAQICATPGFELASITAAVVRSGRVVFAEGVGSRYFGYDELVESLPATAETVYRVASISKLYVALGAMRLVEQKLLDLDYDVGRYLGFDLRHPRYPNTPITLRQLLSHTSTLRDATAYSLPHPFCLMDCFQAGTPYYEDGAHWAAEPYKPGDYFAYCNLNFGVVATIIEVVTQLRFDQFMQNEVLRPLGVVGGYNVTELSEADWANLGTAYRKRSGTMWEPNGSWTAQVDDYGGLGRQRPAQLSRLENPDVQETYAAKFGHIQPSTDIASYRPGQNGTLFSPQGGLRTSVVGLCQLIKLFAGNGTVDGRPFLDAKLLQQMLAANWTFRNDLGNGDSYGGLMRSWGLSVHRFTHSGTAGDGDKLHPTRELRWFGHLGEAYGILSGCLFDSQAGDGVAYIIGGLGNDPERYSGRYSSFTRWEERILELLLEQI